MICEHSIRRARGPAGDWIPRLSARDLRRSPRDDAKDGFRSSPLTSTPPKHVLQHQLSVPVSC